MTNKILNQADGILFVHATRKAFGLCKLSDAQVIAKYNLDDHNKESELLDFIGEDELEQSEHQREYDDWMRETQD